MRHQPSHDPDPAASAPHRPVRSVILIVTLFAVAVDCVAIAGTRLWVCPTSMEYLELATGVAERLDFSNELFLLRTPGYPILLAAIFRLFGTASPTALVLLQHGMTISIVVLTALSAWHLTRRRDVTLLSGLLCACSLQLVGFANQIMTETAFTFALMACVYFALRFLGRGIGRDLILASFGAGVAYLFRPIGLTLVGMVPLAAMVRRCAQPRGRTEHNPKSPSLPVLLGYGLGPAAALVAAWWIHNQVVFGANSVARCYDFALFNRAANVEHRQTEATPAFADLRRVVKEAKAAGRIPSDADENLAWTVWQAYREVEGRSLAESSASLGRAASNSLWNDPLALVTGTVRESAWMILTPDSSYRYLPGGAPGVHGRRPDDADVFDSGLYLEPLAAPLRRYTAYLPLETGPKDHGAIWATITRWYYRHLERGPTLLGIGDSLYEEIVWVCLVAGVLTLLGRDRIRWGFVLAVLVFQVVPSAFVAGVGPRYAVPAQPLLNILGAVALATAIRGIRIPCRELYRFGSRFGGKSTESSTGLPAHCA